MQQGKYTSSIGGENKSTPRTDDDMLDLHRADHDVLDLHRTDEWVRTLCMYRPYPTDYVIACTAHTDRAISECYVLTNLATRMLAGPHLVGHYCGNVYR